ncbi:MAG: sodium:proline symporter, partial [Deltaproteobacteria bacterium]|nr:sodium:proline symporter [Deltaproteobacteria bacterium]
STLNALSALSLEDIIKGFAKRDLSARTELVMSKMLTVFWGSVCLVFSFYVGDVSQTVIESINKIGSLINGPLLAVFVMGMLSRRVNGQGAIIGLVVGFCGNLWLWQFTPKISWLWWNVVGFFVAYAIGYLVSSAFMIPNAHKLSGTLISRYDRKKQISWNPWWPYYMALVVYGLGILLLLIIVTIAVRLR